MPSNNDKYKNEQLVLLLIELRELHTKLKNWLHTPTVRHQKKIPPRKELITDGTVYTKLKDMVIKLLKLKDKKVAKSTGKSGPSKVRVVRVDSALSQFLRLKERGLPIDMYPDTLTTSFFTNWVVAMNLQKGTEISVTGRAGEEFIRLFGEDLKKLGSGPTVKVGDKDPITKVLAVSEYQTSVLDSTGKLTGYPFKMNKHMKIFADHYPQVSKNVGGKYTMGREVINKEEHPQVYERMQQEHKLLTVDLKAARQAYKKAEEDLTKLQAKREKALKIGDKKINEDIKKATDALRDTKRAYIQLLVQNRFPHALTP